MLNYKKPVKVKQRVVENEQVTIAPADTKTQVIKAGNKTIGTVSNPTVANQLKTAIQKGEVNLAQDLKEMDAPPGSVFKVKITYKSPSGGYASGIIKVPANNSDVAKKYVQTHVKKPELRVLSATLDKTTNVDKMFDKTGDAQDLKEEAPPDQEQWVKDNKEKFINQYGKKGEAILYATAWQRHNEGVKESKQLNLDQIFESVAFDEPDPVSHILSKFKFEVNQFCQGSAINPDLYDCLYDYYLDAGLMPYGVAKARDANPIEWVSSKLKDYLGSCGVSYGDVARSEIAAPVNEPVPKYGDDSTEQVADEPIDATDSDEPTEQEINQMFESILGKSLKPKVKESKMKKTVVSTTAKRKVAESTIDRKSALSEAVDPKSVYMVVKNVPRLKDIRCDIGITYDMRYDADSESFSALNLKLIDMATGQKYSQKQVMMDTLRKLMAMAQNDAEQRAEKNDLFHDDFDEDGIPLPVVSGVLKNSKPVTMDYVKVAKSLHESAIDRKAKALVDSWNLTLKQKLKESSVKPKRSLKEGISVSTSQSRGFGYDDIDQNTSINVCATGEDAIRLAEILRDAGFGQFKTNHIAVNARSEVGDNPVIAQVKQPEYDPMPSDYDEVENDEYHAVEDDGESELMDRIQKFVSYGNPASEEITEAEEMDESEVVVHTPSGKLGIVVDADTGTDNEYEVMFADGTEVVSGTDLEPATQAQINSSSEIVKYIGDDPQFEGRYGVIIEEDGDEYHVAFSDGETWIVASDLEAPALQESYANEVVMNQPAKTNYMTHGMSGGLNSLRRSQATGNVTRISTMESKGKQRKMLKESAVRVKPDDDLASMANLVEAISVQQRIKFGA